MTWIDTIAEEDATGRLAQYYHRVKGPDGRVDNIMKAHSLRPHTLEGHMALYKATLHHFGNALGKDLLETLGVAVSRLNDCDYCVEDHLAGLKRHVGDAGGQRLMDNIAAGNWTAFEPKIRAALLYAVKLTTEPATLKASDMEALRTEGFDDGEILEINQVVAYFAYANRTVLGLGVSTEGDTLGLSPNDSDDPDNWSHG